MIGVHCTCAGVHVVRVGDNIPGVHYRNDDNLLGVEHHTTKEVEFVEMGLIHVYDNFDLGGGHIGLNYQDLEHVGLEFHEHVVLKLLRIVAVQVLVRVAMMVKEVGVMAEVVVLKVRDNEMDIPDSANMVGCFQMLGVIMDIVVDCNTKLVDELYEQAVVADK
ncbi:hypothetical protein HDU76_000310, partial [Blyttiomyces sp. JEL0837]